MQSTPASCGPCAAATILRSLGDPTTEAELATAASTTATGTWNWLLARAIRARGHDVTFRDPAQLDDVVPPAVIGVRVHRFGHFLALLGRADNGDYILGEPLQGRRRLDAAGFAAEYQFSNFAMEIRSRPQP